MEGERITMATSWNDSGTFSGRFVPRLFLLLAVVLFISNLGALVDKVLHPDIEYFDEEHLFVGFATGIMTLVLFGGLAFYARSLEKILAKYKKTKSARQESDDKYRRLFESSREILYLSHPHQGGFWI